MDYWIVGLLDHWIIWGAVAVEAQEKNLDPACVGSAYLFLKKKKDIRLRRALGIVGSLDYWILDSCRGMHSAITKWSKILIFEETQSV